MSPPDGLPDTGRTDPRLWPERRTIGEATSLGREILDLLRLTGGRTEGVRRLANQLGRARSTVSDEVHRLVGAGWITSTRGPRGSVLALAP